MTTGRNKLIFTGCVLVFFINLFFILLKFNGFYNLSGDSLCQIAYWKILSRPWLSGSIAASAVKPGQVIVFGLIHQYFNGSTLCVVLALFGAWLTLILGGVAAGMGGIAAGLCCIFLTVGASLEFVRRGDSNLFLIPLLFSGITLYYDARSYAVKNIGLLLLVLASLFRIEAVFAVGVVLLLHLSRREWRGFIVGSCALAMSMGIWLVFLYKIQGELCRFTCSGASTGYTCGPYMPLSAKLSNMVREFTGVLICGATLPIWLLVIIGIIGSCLYFREYRKYLIVLSPILVNCVNYIFLKGALYSVRFYATIYAFGLSVGIGVLFMLLQRFPPRPRRKVFFSLILFISVVGLIVLYILPIRRIIKFVPANTAYIADGLELSRETLLPAGSHILSEDDVLYVLLMNAPDRFKKIYTLQMFNMADESSRNSILADTDFIYLLKRGHGCYYMYVNVYNDRPDLDSDKFRLLIKEIIRSGSKADIYGVTLIPLVNDNKRLILKVVHPFR